LSLKLIPNSKEYEGCALNMVEFHQYVLLRYLYQPCQCKRTEVNSGAMGTDLEIIGQVKQKLHPSPKFRETKKRVYGLI
jgi:hypothetical protein